MGTAAARPAVLGALGQCCVGPRSQRLGILEQRPVDRDLSRSIAAGQPLGWPARVGTFILCDR